MDPALQRESELLARSWQRHDAGMLRDYLVAGVEDPRINVCSVLSRHFLAAALFGDQFQALMDEELRFAVALNEGLRLLRELGGPEDVAAVRHALRQGADDAEGITLPPFLLATAARLPATANLLLVPNYLDALLAGAEFGRGEPEPPPAVLDTFQVLWRQALADISADRLTVLEPACGSANDYRFLDRCGLARFLDYTGIDLCEKNVANARALFPGVRFEVGNVFELSAGDRAFDVCFAHDLFEHLSPGGLAAAIGEICRVTRHSLCAGFFNLDEIPEHAVRTVGEYHWNTLSLDLVQKLFARQGFAAQVFHIGSLLQWRLGCTRTHNPNAYTLVLFRDSQPGK